MIARPDSNSEVREGTTRATTRMAIVRVGIVIAFTGACLTGDLALLALGFVFLVFDTLKTRDLIVVNARLNRLVFRVLSAIQSGPDCDCPVCAEERTQREAAKAADEGDRIRRAKLARFSEN